MRQSESHTEYNVAGTPGKRFALLLLTGLSLPAWSDITLSLDGEVTGSVNWTNLPDDSQTTQINYLSPGSDGVKMTGTLRYFLGSIGHSEPPGMTYLYSTKSHNIFDLGFSIPSRGSDSYVSVSIPQLSCHIQSVEEGDSVDVSAVDETAPSSVSHNLVSAGGAWSGEAILALAGLKTHPQNSHMTTRFSSGNNGTAVVHAGKDALPGTYSLSLETTCSSGGGFFDESTVTFDHHITVVFTLRAAPTTCTLTPPDTVDFGRNIIAGQTSVLLGSREADISARCQTGNGSEDISKGMYLSFSPGSKGLYGNNNKRLKTSLDGIYIAGGSSAPSAGCTVSDMQFDNQVLQAFKMKTITSGINDAKMPLYFSLCHDTNKTLQPGAVESDMGVNLVIK